MGNYQLAMGRGIGAALLLALPGAALAGPAPKVLGRIAPGAWDLRARDPQDRRTHLCVANAVSLMQPRHAGQQCEQYVVQNESERAAVTYNCPKGGRGHTVLRRETGELVQIDTQGVSQGEPFAMALEGRHVPSCASATAQR